MRNRDRSLAGRSRRLEHTVGHQQEGVVGAQPRQERRPSGERQRTQDRAVRRQGEDLAAGTAQERRAVAGVEHADPADEIDQGIAIYIGHERATRAFDSDLMGFV